MTDRLPLLLIVDDEPANLVLLRRRFEPHYRVMCVSGGQAALDMLVQAPFDLILLDIMMPRINGLETLARIRENPKTADIPVILVSSLSDSNNVVQGLQQGANDYVTKPIEMDVLLARVETQLTLKRLQDERKQHIAELQAAGEMKDRFLQMASHDLKGPLGNIGMAQYLLRKILVDDAEGMQLLDIIETTVETMETVIKEFLDSAALHSGQIDLRLETVEVATLIEELTTQYRLSAIKKDITLVVSDTPGLIRADRSHSMQALGNLVSNAIKYSPHHSTVRIWSEATDTHVRVCVADQGQGIPADEHDLLFTQFGKLSPRPTDGESSTGLGLWIVKHLATIQNGQVGVVCPPEGGSIFWIELPVASESATQEIERVVV